MMNKKLTLTRGRAFALAAILAGVLPLSSTAQVAAGDLDELDLITVTGSRLTGATMEGSLPLITISTRDLELSPAATAADYLRNLPIIGGPSTQSSNFSNGTDGAARVGLRNIEGGNTLILFNGRRLQTTGTGGTADLSQIPMNAIKRVEILKAGGSTVYGTSAVAGVINFILDKDFEGLEVNVGYANTFKTDVHELTADYVVGGKGAGGKFSFVTGGTYRKQAAMMAVDRPYMVGGGHSVIPNPGLFFFGPNVTAAIVSANNYAANELTGIFTLKNGVTVASGPQDFKPFVNVGPYDTDALGRNGDRFPFENYTISISPNTQHSFFGVADYQLSDDVKFFTELGYAYSEFRFQLAASPTTNFRVNPANYWYNQIFGSAAVTADAAVGGAAANGPLSYYRFIELGPRYSNYERHNTRMIAGVEIKLPMDWTLEAYAMATQEKRLQAELNGGSNAQVTSLLARTNATAYNFFAASWIRGTTLGGGEENPANPNEALANTIRADNNREYTSKRKLVDARIANPSVFELPAGPVQVVIGAEWRDDIAIDKPDSLKLSGSLGWNAASGTTNGAREVYGVYGEVQLPIIDKLELNLSARYEDYQGEFSTDVFGANVRYQPLPDVTLRASFSQAFVAPEIIDVFNPGLSGFPELNDPFYPSADPLRLYQVQTFYVGSAFTGTALNPETADVYSAGFTLSPRMIKGLDITVDYFKIEKKNLIVYSVQGLLTEFRQSYPGGANGSKTHPPANNPYLFENGGQIVYDASSAQPVNSIRNAGPRNVAGQRLEGIDLDVSYKYDFNQLGSLDVMFRATYFLNMEQQSSTSANWFKFLGEYDGDVAYPRIKTMLSANHTIGDLTVGLTWRHTGRTRDQNVVQDTSSPNFDPTDKLYVERHSEFDVVVQYKLPFFRTGIRETTITAGVQNVLNQKPPLMSTAFSNNYPERNYDPRGAYYFVRLNQKF
jgi:iron complex outermembrane recepter protein